jgi:predicted nucleic acid-binding protein
VKVIVPDASVILKWVLPTEQENDSEVALELRDRAIEKKIQIIVPGLWLYEVGNTLCRLIPKRSHEILQNLIAFGLKEAPMTLPWLKKIHELTQKHAVTFYDAAYHALAIIEKGTFVTADLKYLAKTKESGHIKSLADR